MPFVKIMSVGGIGVAGELLVWRRGCASHGDGVPARGEGPVSLTWEARAKMALPLHR